jgi:hypothetical protein
MTRSSKRLVLLFGTLLVQACQGGGKFQWTGPDQGPGDLPLTDFIGDVVTADTAPDADQAQCGPGFPTDACDTWAKETQGPCMTGRCNDETGRCSAFPVASEVLCNDGDGCTVGDHCVAGTCTGTPVDCDDKVACTVDRCDPVDGCVSTPDDSLCDDDNLCNGKEKCVAVLGCQDQPAATTDATCDGIDDDCDGSTDEEYVRDGACLVGACGLGGTASTCVGGVETPCKAGTAAAGDATCDGTDDDCSGAADEDYVVVAGCGVGACATNAVPSSCVAGVETACRPGTAAAGDATCNGIDDDCNGTTDEDYVPVTACGVGQCGVAPTPSSCVGGVVTPCQPGAAAATDATCDGIDDDCSGKADEDYVPVTSCGLGACARSALPSFCVSGHETPCQPGIAAASDATCDGVDNDCEGTTDEDYVPVTTCLQGACGFGGSASVCAGGHVTACTPPVPAATDATCDGVDDDCDGATDDDYVPNASCLAACGLGGVPSACAGGVEAACLPPSGATTDATCDGVDDDCDGVTDQGYVPDATCGVGACRTRNVPSSCQGGGETACVPGIAAPTDATCDGVDDDCDGTTDEDSDPPCDQIGSPVAGAKVVFGSTLGTPSGIVTDNGDGTYGAAVVDLTNPGLSGTVRALAGGNASTDRAFATSPVETATVRAISSRDEVFSDDSRVKVYAFVTDGIGSPVASTRTVTFRTTGATTVTATATPAGGGVFSATLTVPTAAFAVGGVASLVADCDGVSSSSVAIAVRKNPSALVTEPGELGLELPLGPRFDNSLIDVPVYVNTGANTIGSYDLRIDFDPAVLEVLSVGQGAATDLAPPVSNAATTANTLGSLSFNAINANPTGTTARGARVQVAVAHFRVRTGVAAGTAANVSGAALGLYNTVGAGVSFLANPVILVRDGDGPGDSGVVRVKNVATRGVFARMDDNVLLHTRPFDGVPTSTAVAVLAVQSDGAIADVRASPGTTCAPTDGGVASATGCAIAATGGGFTPITASVGAVSGTTNLWVLATGLPLDVRVSDPTLGHIVELDRDQQARTEVRASFAGGSFAPFTMDVTSRVRFASSAPGILSVDAATGLATPVADGAAQIQVLGEGDAVLGAAPVVVDAAALTHVTGMRVLVPATVLVDQAEPNPVPDRTGTLTVQARVTNLFTAEGRTAQAAALLVLSDDAATAGGSRVDVTAAPTTRYSTGDALIGSVDAGGVVTAIGGGRTDLTASFEDAGGAPIASGSGTFKVLLPKPIGVDATVTDPRVALSDADVAATLLGLPSSRPITVRVHFEDGTSKDFTADPRTRYDAVALDPADLLSVDDAASCAGVTGCVPGTAHATGTGAGRASIGISFPGTYLEAVSATVELQVVTHQGLTVESWELHTPASTTRVVERVLSFIENSGVRQRSRLEVRNRFTDGSSLDVTAHPQTTFSVYVRGTSTPIAGVLSIDASAVVRGVSDGLVDVVARNSGHGSPPLQMAVDPAKQDLADLTLTYAAGTTFLGIKDVGQATLAVVGRFADGTHNILTGGELIPGLLRFASSAVQYATVAATGVATARGNGPVTMTVDVDPIVDTGTLYDPPKPLSLAVNLLPDVGDVDLGNSTGLAFPDRTGDEYFDMPVRVNSGSRTLGGIDLEITYDPSVLLADSARVGSGIPGALFAANVSEPGRIYLNASPPIAGAGVSGAAIEVAVLRFKAIKSAGGPRISAMGGVIRGFIDRTGVAIGGAVPRNIVAGAGDLDPDSSGLFGDANDDNEFSIADILFIQQITVVPPLVVPNPTQQAQSDLFPDGTVMVNDAFYASQVLARLSHFVDVQAVPDPIRTGEVLLRTHVVDRDQTDVTAGIRVRYEVATVLNAGTIAFTGARSGTANGVLTEAAHVGGGVWTTQVSGLTTAEPGIGVVVILDVLNAGGAVVNATAFLETPLLDAAATFKPLVTFDASGCLATDTTCNGMDDDCNGATDDGYVPAACGTGACASVSACVNGVEAACQAGLPAATDASCNGIDDDCNGATDEDYAPDATCGVGACNTGNTPSTCAGGTETACRPGLPAATDATCNGVDDDCSGATDEGYVPDAACGVGACLAGNSPSTCVGGTETACRPGLPAATDATCNGVDDDCDGATDQGACHDGALCWDDGAACDDGLAYTLNDTCAARTCAGTAEDCAPYVDFGDVVALTDVTLGASGFPGQGLDVDGDGATCAPVESGLGVTPWCSDGIDNELSVLETLLSPVAADLLAGFTQGSVLGDFRNATFDGSRFVLPLYMAEVGPTTPGCDPKTETCDYVLPREDFDGQCKPLYFWDNATIVGDLLTAGGAGYAFTVPTRYGVSATVHGTQVSARLAITGGHVTGMLPGSLAAGAIRVDEALALLDAAFPGPEDTIVYATYTKGFVRNVLQNLVAPDVDTDGDGTPDAVSFGLRVQAGRGVIVDVGTPCAAVADCEDGNPCTTDTCLPEAGCTRTFNSDRCDDGDPATVSDTCMAGACVGSIPDCGARVAIGDLVAINDASLGVSGFPGQGLDVDGDGATCAPALDGSGMAPGCSDGIDNALSVTNLIVNPAIDQILTGSTWGTILGDFQAFQADGVPFRLPFYLGNVVLDRVCDYQTQNCEWDLPYFNFSPTCEPMWSFDNAVIVGDRLTAGGPGQTFRVSTWIGDAQVTIPIFDVVVDVQVTREAGRVVGFRTGSLAGGAFRIGDALMILDAQFPGPEDTVIFEGYTKGFVRTVLQNVVTPDVDVNGDGIFEAVSFGALFTGLGGLYHDVRAICRTSADCDDGNPCTTDGCWLDNGCSHIRTTAACDDGNPLTVGDTCVLGACQGTIQGCGALVTVGDLVAINDASLGVSGFPGQGLDVDGQGLTCAPALNGSGTGPGCSDGIDNALSVTESILNPAIDQVLAGSTWGTILGDFGAFQADGVPFRLPFYMGNVVLDRACDFQTQNCEWDLPYFNFGPTCEPMWSFGNAVIVGDRLTAGGPGQDFVVSTWVGGAQVEIPVFDVVVDVRVTRQAGHVVGIQSGSLAGGAFRMSDAMALLDTVFPGPEDTVVYEGYTKGFLRSVLQNLVTPDVDVNGDGVVEAVSFGALFTGLGGELHGVREICSTSADCDDGNPCTADGCWPDNGCSHIRTTVACDDGNPLTLGDTCLLGTCQGTIPDCGPLATVGDLVAINDASLGVSGFPGQGLDVDGRTLTCAPAMDGGGTGPGCSDGIDNALSVTNSILNPAIDQVLAGSTWGTILGDFGAFQADGVPFRLPFYLGNVVLDRVCDFQTQTCEFDLPYFNFGATCQPMWSFANAVIVGDRLTAGGPGQGFEVSTWTGTAQVTIPVFDVAVDVRVVRDAGHVVGIQSGGLAGGAFRMSDAMLLLDVQFPGPEDIVVYEGYTKGFLRSVLQNLLTPDVDVNGDGVFEAVSFGVLFTGLGAQYHDVRAICRTDADCDDGNPCTSDGCWLDNGCSHLRMTTATCLDGTPIPPL